MRKSKFPVTILSIIASFLLSYSFYILSIYIFMFLFMFIGLLLIAQLIDFPVKNKVQWLSLTIALIFGIYSYNQVLSEQPLIERLTNSLYYAAKLFTINIEPVFNGQQLHFTLEIARWSAILFVISAVLTNIYKLSSEYFRLLFLSFKGGHYVISGITPYSKILAEGLLQEGKDVVIITEETETHHSLDLLHRKGAIIIHGSLLHNEFFQKAAVESCSHFLLTNEEDTRNIDIFLKSIEFLKEEHFLNEEINIHIHIHEPKYYQVIDELEKEINRNEPKLKKLEIKVFNIYENSSTLLFDQYPIFMNKKKDSTWKPHLLIVGFGNTGQQVLLQYAKICHFGNEEKLQVTIIDKIVSEKKAYFLKLYPKIKEVCDLKFIEANIYDEACLDQIYENIDIPVSYIVVSLTNDHTDFINGMLLAETFKGIPILMKMDGDIHVAKWIDKNVDKYEMLYRFGDWQRSASTEVVINEKLDDLAKAIHNHYCKENGLNICWNDLSTTLKDSNRAQAAHIDVKLYLLGLKRKGKAENDTCIDKQTFLLKAEAQLEQLAKAEHSRWKAFYYIHGWKSKTAELPLKDEKNREHACLVPWEELQEIDKHFQKKYVELNKNVVRDLYDILTANGYTIYEAEEMQEFDPTQKPGPLKQLVKN